LRGVAGIGPSRCGWSDFHRWTGVHRCYHGLSYCYYGFALRVSGGDDYLPALGSYVYQLTWFRMGQCFTDGPARRVVCIPGDAGTDLRAIAVVIDRQLFGAGTSLRNRCGRGLERIDHGQSAPPSVSEEVPDFLASPQNSSFTRKNE
jgi:hypothetical protein